MIINNKHILIRKFKIKISIKKCLYFLFLVLMNYKIIADGLIEESFDFVDAKVWCCICVLAVRCIGGFKNLGKYSNKYLYFDCMMLVLCAVVALRSDSFFMRDFCMILALTNIIRFNDCQFSFFVWTSLVAILPGFLRWFLVMIHVGGFLGNRGPIHFTTVIILIVAWMHIKNIKPKWQYSCLIIATVLDFWGNSRTYLIACSVAFLLLTFYTFKGKLTIKKLLTILGGIIIATIVIINLQDKIMDLFTNKWGGQQTTIFTGRSMMWIDVFSRFKWIGYPENYIQDKYSLGNVHNAFIQAYVSYGVIFAIMYIILIILAIKKCINNRNNIIIQGLSIAFIPVTIAAFFESNFIMESGYVYLGVCNAVLIGQIFRESSNMMVKRNV